MNLSEFVEETLSETLAGKGLRRKRRWRSHQRAEMYGDATAQGIVNGGCSGNFTIVQFDVSVAAETKARGKGGLRVWSVGLDR